MASRVLSAAEAGFSVILRHIGAAAMLVEPPANPRTGQ
jgi:hypothetical protein